MPHNQPGNCPIVDLDLSDLKLNVLGLIVHVPCLEVGIVADPDGGLLGNLLCGLLSDPQLKQAVAESLARSVKE